ncbi:MAG TPA: response regulator [Dehalococcoidia bacterium]|nr:response regulator [Dehalococcoidia bacterium]
MNSSLRPEPLTMGTWTSAVRPVILLVEDDELTRQAFEEALHEAGFETALAASGAEGLRRLAAQPVDLIIADVMMPDMDGFELCRRVSRDPQFGHIPILLLSARTSLSDRLAGIRGGADDYLTKPIDIEELIARLSMHLRRSSREQQLNPLTRLPGNLAIEQALRARLMADEAFAVGYVDLDHFKAYNDRYGFHAGDELIRFTGRLLATVIAPYRAGGFVGHIGGDDFMVVAGPEAIRPICEEIIRRFDAEVAAYYTPEDRSRGYIQSVDRSGRERTFPLATISIGVVICEPGAHSHLAEIAQIASEAKSFAKQHPGSTYHVDRRNHG